MEDNLKKCKFCGKEYANLGQHIANLHPRIMEQLEEYEDLSEKGQPISTRYAPQQQKTQNLDINQMIYDKLNLMLNIKVIEMLGNSKDTSLQDIQKAITPKKETTLSELKEFHDLIYNEKEDKELPIIDTGNQWIDIAQQAIPIIREMLPAKKQELKQEIKQNELQSGNKGLTGTIKPICIEIAGSAGKPTNVSTESGIVSKTKQSNDNINRTDDKSINN